MGHKGLWGLTALFLVIISLAPLTGDSARREPKTGVSAAFAVRSGSGAEAPGRVKPGRIRIDELNDKDGLQEQMTVPDANESAAVPVDDKSVAVSENDAHQTEEQEITLLTFNIHGGGREMQDGLEKIVDEIKETGAQIVGLQEVERMMPRSGYKDQAKVIAEELGYNYYYGSNINILGVQYGNAFLSKYPIIEANNHKLPKELIEPRGIIEALIDVEGVPYRVFVTHLGLDADERAKQTAYISDLVSDLDGNILLMGDFNNKPDSAEMDGFAPQLADTASVLGRDDQYTYSIAGQKPDTRIDRIYASKNITLKDNEVLSSSVSDHYRVITRIIHKFIK